LDLKLREKEDEVIAYMQADEQKSQEIRELTDEIEQLKITNCSLENELNQIKEVVYDTITDKNNTIEDLNRQLQEFHDTESTNNLREVIGSLEEKYRDL
jgi:chromosome segregation ATPase